MHVYKVTNQTLKSPAGGDFTQPTVAIEAIICQKSPMNGPQEAKTTIAYMVQIRLGLYGDESYLDVGMGEQIAGVDCHPRKLLTAAPENVDAEARALLVEALTRQYPGIEGRWL